MRQVPVVFTGNAQDLRLHSRRDLLVNIVLGGLYTSVARRHIAEYLVSHTAIDGTPLVRVPPARRRWPAMVLVLALVALRVANEFGTGPPLPWLVILATLLVPYLWATVTQRTIDAIRWRAWKLSFEARWGEIFRASWPLLVLGVAWALAEPKVAALTDPDAVLTPADAYLGTAAVALVVGPLLAIQAFNWRRLRFTRTRVGELELAWPARLASYLRICFLFALGMLLTAILPVLALRYALLGSVGLQGLPTGEALAVYAIALTAVILLSAPARAWYEAQVFVLTWDGLRVGERLLVQCALDPRAYARMKTRETWRTALTFGAHRAHAVVNAYEAKLAALTLFEN